MAEGGDVARFVARSPCFYRPSPECPSRSVRPPLREAAETPRPPNPPGGRGVGEGSFCPTFCLPTAFLAYRGDENLRPMPVQNRTTRSVPLSHPLWRSSRSAAHVAAASGAAYTQIGRAHV